MEVTVRDTSTPPCCFPLLPPVPFPKGALLQEALLFPQLTECTSHSSRRRERSSLLILSSCGGGVKEGRSGWVFTPILKPLLLYVIVKSGQ